MMRSTALRTFKPLRRRAPLRSAGRHRGFKPRRDTGPSKATRRLVLARDGGCVVCGDAFRLQVHHRKPRRLGGRSIPEINSPANLVSVCRDDHEWIESRRAEALEVGLLVAEHDDPADVPVQHYRFGFVYLTVDGGYELIPHVGGDAK